MSEETPGLATVKPYLVSSARSYAIVVAIAFLVGLVNAFNEGLGIFLLLCGLPFLTILLLTFLIVWFVRGVRLAKQYERFWVKAVGVLASPVLLAAAMFLVWPSLIVGGRLGDLARLALNQRHYEAIIAKARRDHKASWYEEDGGVTYSVDLGPPIRVAFNPAGMLDNWSGIIFDPTGVVMTADGFDPVTGKFRAPEAVTKLFGGDLVSCRHLWGSYYSCAFT
ncbi:hypothetical protein [Novosphingobium naphthalenivorans]|uniref:hypothetical protein n=1 Tax=Novosphingobium naphthalenivorans TaxID=273168 RepID=UPI000B0043D5|nr:hypothetical protein [Novosphingobium naphthalenivorans]